MPTLTVNLDDPEDVKAAIPILNAIAAKLRGESGTRVELHDQGPTVGVNIVTAGRDYTKYDVTVGNRVHPRLNKRHAAFVVVKHLCDMKVATPQQIEEICRQRERNGSGPVRDSKMFDLVEIARMRPSRFFLRADELIECNKKTYAVSNQWGRTTLPVIERLSEAFPEQGITAVACP